MLRAEDLLASLDRQIFDDVGMLTPAVVALPGIAFGILVGQQGALRRQDCGTGKVLRRNEQQFLTLSDFLCLNCGTDLRICSLQGVPGTECVAVHRLHCRIP